MIDEIDARILNALQRDAQRPIADLAREVGLSTSACHRRVKLLESGGMIRRYVAELDREALGLTLQVFLEITLTSQAREVLEAFEAAVMRAEEVLECHLTSGHADYILRVAAQDMADYDRLHRNRLARLPHVASMQTIFAIRPIKSGGGLPVRAAR
jgi:DNA-binding Lrp family transcriptional regulator